MADSQQLYYGGDYYPEQWPEDVWEEDVRLMREAGVNLATVGVFAWSRLEPRPGEFDFGWLDRVLDLLANAGIGVDLATATASPPPWLAYRHPETLPALADGTRLWPGGRQQYCPSSPVYRDAARRLARAMAERYGKHPALRLWHVGNEYGCHVQACWCDASAAAFRDWLRARYGTLDALNEAWGTAFWSQHYGHWEEVLPPRKAPTYPNPSQELDFLRFSSDAFIECYEMERAVLAEYSPGVPITTNLMGLFRWIDYWKLARGMDLVSNDHYQDPADPDAPMRAAMAADLMRSLGHGRPWMLMEQTTSRVNWRQRNVAKPPGRMRLWSYQAVARGADGILFFQWRQSRFGAEKFHSAMVPHGPAEGSRVWQETAQLGGELGRLGAVAGTTIDAKVAILLDWESWWALELPSKPSADLRLIDQVEAHYRPLFEAGVTVDFAHPEADLSRYRLVLAPNLYLVSDEAATNLAAFVERGGVLAMSFFSGIVDERDHVRLGGYPAPFADVLGLVVEDFLPLAEGETADVAFEGGPASSGELWSELVHLRGAVALARFTSGPAAFSPAVTRHKTGSGAAYYLATRLDPRSMASVLEEAMREAGVEPAADVPEAVEAVRRGPLLFLLNHDDAEVTVPVARGATDLLSGTTVADGRLTLAPIGVAVVKE